jgi:hypothetical protein
MKGLVARPLLAFDYLEAESTQYCNRRLKRIVTRRFDVAERGDEVSKVTARDLLGEERAASH